MTNKKTPDFKYIYSNGFALQFGGVEFMLGFGIKENVQSEDVTEQVCVVMTPSSVKLLSVLLTKFVAAIEAGSGEIPLEPEKIEKMDNALRAAEADRQRRIDEKAAATDA